MDKPLFSTDRSLNEAIQELGRSIFDEIQNERPSAFDRKFWAGRMLQWSMRHTEFKVNMLRLVDVLPSLRSSSAIARHAQEYLAELIHKVPGLFGAGIVEWGLRAKPRSLRGHLTSFLVMRGVRQMASLFIAGENPRKALPALERVREHRTAFTVDLLGEYSVSEKEADAYLERYLEALKILGREVPRWKSSTPLTEGHPGESSAVCVSVKLTALYSQCSVLNMERSVQLLSEKLSHITREAKKCNGLLYVDAEDCANNPIIYATYKQVFGSSEFRDYPYPGIVVQAYARDAQKIIEDLLHFAKQRGNPIAIRLVKGAYWDHETITSSQSSWPSPLFSKKESSDANFEQLSRVLLENTKLCLPAFGSHNVRSLAHACAYAGHLGLSNRDFELQMLYGMAEPIARAFSKRNYLVRLYVPLGDMVVGMGYLVRRLLENTSNESFLRQTFHDPIDVRSLLADPVMRE